MTTTPTATNTTTTKENTMQDTIETISHVDISMPKQANEFGQPVLADQDTNLEWWKEIGSDSEADVSIRDMAMVMQVKELMGDPVREVTARPLIAMLSPEMPAKVTPDNYRVGVMRDPDLFDDGMAFWITDNAVVAVAVERLERVPGIVAIAKRLAPIEGGWKRVNPFKYGIKVTSFFPTGETGEDGEVEVAEHSDHEAWTIIDSLITN